MKAEGYNELVAAALYLQQGELVSRALAFTTLIIGNLALIFTNRSRSRTILATLSSNNVALWIVVGSALGFLALSLTVPFLSELFRFGQVSLFQVLLCVAVGIISILWFEVLKTSGPQSSSE